MNIFTHEEYLKERLRRAKRMQMAGMLCIVLSFLLSLAFGVNATVGTYLVLLAYPLLLVGFPLWTIGRNTQKRLGGAPRADQLLNNELKGLNNKYSLHHYADVGGAVIKHLLVTPAGLVAIETRDAVGYVSCAGGPKGDRWKGQTNLLDRVMGQKPAVGNPTKDLDVSVQAAQQLLVANNKSNIPVKGLVVFTKNPDLHLDGCTYAAVPLNETKQAIKDLQYDMGGDRDESASLATILTSEDRRKLNSVLAPKAVATPPKKPASVRR